MTRYMGDEELWLADYTSAWKLATTNGHKGLRYLDQTKSDPEPVIDECASVTSRKQCKREMGKVCEWKHGFRKGHDLLTRAGCVARILNNDL